jgi:glutamate synthase (NADPH/NADH) small chain
MPGSEFDFPCDQVIPAVGQSRLMENLESSHGIRLRNGLIEVDRATGQTSNSRYFAGGDCVNGGREVVDAVADGKRAARAIIARLEAR